MRHLFAALFCFIALAPAARAAGGCDEWLGKTVRATGTYLPAEEPYARPFVFAMSFNCRGTRERVTVQRPTGGLPVCRNGQQVEVLGTLVWNHFLVAGHYEINKPASVICR